MGSNESLNNEDEASEDNGKKETSKAVGKVDTELITLHQNVTQLSIEVDRLIALCALKRLKAIKFY